MAQLPVSSPLLHVLSSRDPSPPCLNARFCWCRIHLFEASPCRVSAANSRDSTGNVRISESDFVKMLTFLGLLQPRLKWFPGRPEPRFSVERECEWKIREVRQHNPSLDYERPQPKINMLMPTLFSLRRRCERARATLDYWGRALAEKMSDVRVKGRGWDTASWPGELLPGKMVVLFSEHYASSTPPVKRKKLLCGCNLRLASSWKRRSSKCSKREKPCMTLDCGCWSLCGRVGCGLPAVPILYIV